MIPLASDSKGISFSVRVVPRTGRTEIAGVREDALLVRIAAAPVEGAANDALVSCLADGLRVPRRHITIVAGLKSRGKRVSISGVTAEQLAQKLFAILHA